MTHFVNVKVIHSTEKINQTEDVFSVNARPIFIF